MCSTMVGQHKHYRTEHMKYSLHGMFHHRFDSKARHGLRNLGYLVPKAGFKIKLTGLEIVIRWVLLAVVIPEALD